LESSYYNPPGGTYGGSEEVYRNNMRTWGANQIQTAEQSGYKAFQGVSRNNSMQLANE
jgi:hypothetical protein